jgi:hypothetical protein
MQRDEILKEFTVDSNGIIRNPGKFENEMLYVPYFWDAALNAGADDDIRGVFFAIIDDDDRAQFPELGESYGIALDESEQGFVSSTVFDSKDEYLEALERLQSVEESSFDEYQDN